MPAPVWHGLDIDETLARLSTDRHRGPMRAKVEQWLARVGPNQLPPRRRRPVWLRLAHQFHDVLVYVMLAAAAITAGLGHGIDTAVLLAAVVVNVLIGFIQGGKAEQDLDAIRRTLSLREIAAGMLVFSVTELEKAMIGVFDNWQKETNV